MTIDIVVPDALKKTYERMHFAPAVKYNGLIMCSGVIGTVDVKCQKKPKTNSERHGRACNILYRRRALLSPIY